MITDEQKSYLKESWRLVVPIADTAADLFYRRLFELKPEYRRLFPEDMAKQKRKLVSMLDFVVKSLDWPESAWRDMVDEENDLFLIVLALGRRHSKLYRVPDDSYDAVGAALIWTLDYGLGKKFEPPIRAAWEHVYKLLSLTMRMGRLSVEEPVNGEDALTHAMASDAATKSHAGGDER